MLAISVELLHGTFRGDPDGTAVTGGLTRGEWPPSPTRLFAAMIAADGTRSKCRATDGSELEWFERLPPPLIQACPAPHHQPLVLRYVVRHKGSAVRGAHQEYVGRSGTPDRSGVRLSLRDPRVVYVWDSAAPPGSVFDGLRRRAARVGYLGTSDSPVRVRVTRRKPVSFSQENAFVPDSTGRTIVRVPKQGDLTTFDRIYDEWFKRGADVSRSHFPALRHGVRYRSPATPKPVDRGRVVACLRLSTPLSGRRISRVTVLFKEAILSQHQRIFGEPPPVLHGHGFTEKGYEIARYLALPDVGYRWSLGRIHGLALWMPPECDSAEIQRARAAAVAIRRLIGMGVDVSVRPREDNARTFAINPRRWQRESSTWVTAFPAIHERRRVLDLSEIKRWCRHAGLPEPVAFRSSRTPLVPGAIDLAPVEVNRPRRPPLPYSHVAIKFATPVKGPVVVGSGRQRGFGLCVPVDD